MMIKLQIPAQHAESYLKFYEKMKNEPGFARLTHDDIVAGIVCAFLKEWENAPESKIPTTLL